MERVEGGVIVSPVVISIDTREQSPYGFLGIKPKPSRGATACIIRTVARTLHSGDYSIDGHADLIAVERKSVEDAYGTFSHGRDRFERELERLNFMAFAAVVIEGGWGRLIGSPPSHSRLRPESVFGSIIAWQQRYPRVHWLTCPDRRFAEITTFRILERFWRDRLDPKLAGKTTMPATVSTTTQRIGAIDAVAAR